jgi:hypothetical protein
MKLYNTSDEINSKGHYFERIAVTGSILAADHAGIIPDKTPIIVEVNKPQKIFLKLKIKVSEPSGKKDNNHTIPIPTKPPIKLNKTDSKRN